MKRWLLAFCLTVALGGALAHGEESSTATPPADRVWDTTRPPAPYDPAGHKYADTPPEYFPYSKFTDPYRRYFLQPLQYRGYGRQLPEPEKVESVKIGFIGPIMKTVSVATGGASHEEPLGLKMLQGARMAIDRANQNGGYRGSGIPYELVIRNDNGLWGSTGNEVITLAYKDNVWAIIGSIDGANSHIAIRVALKIEIPVMNTGDTDPTFIETNIPWVFRCITDDRQMCYFLADYVYKKLKLSRVAALRANNRYGRISIDEFRDASTRSGHPFLAELNYKVGDTDFTPQLKRIQSLKPGAVITYGDALESALVLKQMRDMGMNQLFIGSDRLVSQEFLDLVKDQAGDVIAGFPYNPVSTDPVFLEFVKDFQARYGEAPETYAAHAYDGTVMTIQAIERAGLNRALIRDELARLTTYHGVTGEKVFDAIYNNISPAYLARLENGEFKFYSRADLGLDNKVSLEETE